MCRQSDLTAVAAAAHDALTPLPVATNSSAPDVQQGMVMSPAAVGESRSRVVRSGSRVFACETASGTDAVLPAPGMIGAVSAFVTAAMFWQQMLGLLRGAPLLLALLKVCN